MEVTKAHESRGRSLPGVGPRQNVVGYGPQDGDKIPRSRYKDHVKLLRQILEVELAKYY